MKDGARKFAPLPFVGVGWFVLLLPFIDVLAFEFITIAGVVETMLCPPPLVIGDEPGAEAAAVGAPLTPVDEGILLDIIKDVAYIVPPTEGLTDVELPEPRTLPTTNVRTRTTVLVIKAIFKICFLDFLF